MTPAVTPTRDALSVGDRVRFGEYEGVVEQIAEPHRYTHYVCFDKQLHGWFAPEELTPLAAVTPPPRDGPNDEMTSRAVAKGMGQMVRRPPPRDGSPTVTPVQAAYAFARKVIVDDWHQDITPSELDAIAERIAAALPSGASPRDGSETPLPIEAWGLEHHGHIIAAFVEKADASEEAWESNLGIEAIVPLYRASSPRGQRPEDAPRMSEQEADDLLAEFVRACDNSGRFAATPAEAKRVSDQYRDARAALKRALCGLASSGE